MKTSFIAAAAAAALAMSGTVSRASIVVNLTSPQAGTTVPVGTVIHAIVSATTNDPNGIQNLQTRLETTLDGVNADVHPYHFSLIATSATNHTSNQAVVSSFNAALNDPNAILAKGTAKFGTDGQPSVSPSGDEPLFGYTGDSASGRAAPAFTNPNGTEFFDVSFRADNPGIVSFMFTSFGNGLQGAEFAQPFTDSSSDPTGVSTTVTPGQQSGFTITIAPVPEPASFGLLAAAMSGAMLRRRK